MLVAGGSTNVTTYFALRKLSDGTGATGLDVTDFDLQYVRSGAVAVAKVNAQLLGGGVGGTHDDNDAIEVDATDQPGLYRVDWPDAAFAAGVREVILTVKEVTVFTEHLRIEIDGEVNVAKWLGTAVTTPDTAGIPMVNIDEVKGDALGAGQLSRWAASGLRNGTASSGTTTTAVDTSLTTADGTYVGGTITFGSGGHADNERQSRLITGFLASADRLTFTPALPQAITTELYNIVPSGGVTVNAWLNTAVTLSGSLPDVNVEAMDEAAITAGVQAKIIGVTSGTATGGSSTTLIDTGRAETGSGYFRHSVILFTSGDNVGQVRRITGYNDGTDTFSWAPATKNGAIVNGNTYTVLAQSSYYLRPDNEAFDSVALDASGRIDVGEWLGQAVTAATAGVPDVNTARINDAAVVGDGNAVPWDGA